MREGWCNVAFSPTFQAAQAVSGGSLRVGSEKRIRGSSGVGKKRERESWPTHRTCTWLPFAACKQERPQPVFTDKQPVNETLFARRRRRGGGWGGLVEALGEPAEQEVTLSFISTSRAVGRGVTARQQDVPSSPGWVPDT